MLGRDLSFILILNACMSVSVAMPVPYSPNGSKTLPGESDAFHLTRECNFHNNKLTSVGRFYGNGNVPSPV